ncbi:MAG: undecaprenyl-diphosphate phosphatase [Lachnospiraceae bacterium]|nr:undecaprenyl-diphosphate phosphatase [Lachnospiraceae bacterium]
MIEIIKSILFGIVEGITEWLPISSTGHLILLDEFVRLNVSDEFWDLFLVVIQLGAILAVIVIYWKKLLPLSRNNGRIRIDRKKCSMWMKIIVASIPAAVVGLLWDDLFTALFYNYFTVAIMLIVVGFIFIVVENAQRRRRITVDSIDGISYGQALVIGLCQTVAAVFPGTSRSGSTIIGGLLLGISRTTAAEFTFFLAIPAMVGGSAIKVLKYDGAFVSDELLLLGAGTLVAFIVSIIAIKFLMSYIKKHDFTAFGWYRIALGVVVLAYFALR